MDCIWSIFFTALQKSVPSLSLLLPILESPRQFSLSLLCFSPIHLTILVSFLCTSFNSSLSFSSWAAFQYLKGAYRKDGERLFTRVCSDRKRGNGCKLKEGRFRIDTRKKFFTMRVVKHWNRFPSAVVDVPSLEVFKARLDGALSNLV